MNIIFANRDNIGLMELLMLIIYSLFDGKVNMIFITNKNKTSYDALLVDMLFISSCNGDNCDFNWMWDMFYAVINFWVSIKGCDFDLCWRVKVLILLCVFGDFEIDFW